MKFLRPLLIVVGIVAVIGAIAVGLALTPSVQRWAVLKATASTPGLKLELARVSAGFGHLELSEVKAEQSGIVVKLGRLEADYSLAQFLFGSRLKISRLAASGVIVDASRLDTAGQAASAGAPAAVPGVLAQITLPFELVLDDVNIEGVALLPMKTAGQPLKSNFKVTGGKFAPNQEGTILLSASVKNADAASPVSSLSAQVNVRATQTDQRSFSHVSATAVLDAEGKGLSGQTQLKIVAELARDAVGENYTVNVDTLINGSAEKLVSLNAKLPAGQKAFSGEWNLKARKAQLAPFLMGGVLPEFDAGGEGSFTVAADAQSFGLKGKLNATISRLELMEPAWRAIGTVKTNVVFDLAEAASVVKLNELKVSLSGDHPVLDLQTLTSAEYDLTKGSIQVGGTGPTEVLDFKLIGLPLAWVRPFVTAADISGDQVSGHFVVSSDSGRLLVRSVEPLKINALNVVQQGVLLLSRADISLLPEAVLSSNELQAEIKQFSLKTPAGDSLSAQFATKVPFPLKAPYLVKASYSADFPALLANYVPLGRIKSTGDFDLTLTENQIELRRFNTSVADGAGLTLFSASNLRTFGIDLVKGQAITGETKSTDLLKITVGTIPLSKVPLSQSGMQLGGTLAAGDFVLSTEGAKMVLRAAAPITLSGLTLRTDGQPTLTGLNVQAQPVIEITDRHTGIARTGEVTVKNETGATLLSLNGEASSARDTGVTAKMTFNVDVPSLGSQPVFAGAKEITAGKASGEVRAAVGAVNQFEARVTVNGLVARNAEQGLPIANLSLRAVRQADGKISIQAPLLLDRAGQRSDLNFAMDLAPSGKKVALSGKLSGEHIELSDALAVLSVFQTSTDPAKPAQPTPSAPAVVASTKKATPDTLPVWAGVSGQFLLDIKSVTQGKSWSMTGLTGVVSVDPNGMRLEKFETKFDEKSRLTATGNLNFTAGSLPYSLKGSFALTEFDAGKLFKAFDPSKPATIEGLFNVSGSFVGDGENITRTFERTRGQFDFTSRQGIFRGLQRATGKLSMTSKAVELGASVLGSIFGSEKATKTAEKVAGQAYFVDQLAQSLGEFAYDQLSVKLVRDDSLNVTMKDISLVSQEIRLIGKGTLTHVDDKTLLDYPLNISMSLAARGKVEQLLGKMHLTDSTKDELGFTKTKEAVTLGGTLGKPDATAFFTKIATAKLGDFLSSEN